MWRAIKVALPFANAVAEPGWRYRVVVLLMCVKCGFIEMFCTAGALMINNCVGPASRGALNGLSSTLCGPMRVLGPMVCRRPAHRALPRSCTERADRPTGGWLSHTGLPTGDLPAVRLVAHQRHRLPLRRIAVRHADTVVPLRDTISTW